MMDNVVQIWPMLDMGPGVLEQIRGLSTPMLKRMWDDRSGRWDGLCDEIHMVMNERGEGSYVAV